MFYIYIIVYWHFSCKWSLNFAFEGNFNDFFLLRMYFQDSTILMVPWFLNNAIGVFPLGPMIVSSFRDCKLFLHFTNELNVLLILLRIFLRQINMRAKSLRITKFFGIFLLNC